jgi:hypothetical protein
MRVIGLREVDHIPVSYEVFGFNVPPPTMKNELHLAVPSSLLRNPDGTSNKYPPLPPIIGATIQFKTWSLFPISNPAWLGTSTADKINELFESFIGFARAIGHNHAAVWFGELPWKGLDDRSNLEAFDLAAHIDSNRSAAYCAKFGLDVAKGPHILALSNHPDSERTEVDVLLELNGLSPESTRSLLAALATQLLNKKISEKDLQSKKWRLAWRDACKSVIRDMGKIILDGVGKHTWSIKVYGIEITVKPPA